MNQFTFAGRSGPGESRDDGDMSRQQRVSKSFWAHYSSSEQFSCRMA